MKIFRQTLGPLLKTGLPLIKNVLKPLGKSILIPLELTTAAATTDVAIHQEMFGSGCALDLAPRKTTLIISNEEMDDIMKIVISLEESGLFIEGISEAIKNEAKKQKRDFSVCYQVYQLLVYQEIYQQIKTQLTQMKARLKQARTLNSASSFNKF